MATADVASADVASAHSYTSENPPTIAVLDYGIGNLRSAEKALEHVGAVAVLTADADEVAEAAGGHGHSHGPGGHSH